jgi:hypothetical protein
LVDAFRDALSWLGKCQREQAGHSMHLVFRFAPDSAPQTALKLKVEINTREHEVLFGYRRYPFEVASDWYSARTEIVSFEPEELFGTKLRALLQRRKNRDLFDLDHGLMQLGLDRDKVVTCLNHFLALEDHPISRAEAEERMLKKLTRSLTEDIEPLLPVGGCALRRNRGDRCVQRRVVNPHCAASRRRLEAHGRCGCAASHHVPKALEVSRATATGHLERETTP